MMSRDFKLEKRLLVAALALLIIADVALAVYGWRMAATPRSQQELANLTRNRDLLRADIKRGQDIRQKIPAIAKDCDQFEQSLAPESTGYSQVSAELGAMAAKSGLQLESRTFKQEPVKGRGLTEVEIAADVSGSYDGVVKFLNALQRSNNVYAVESLAAKSETGTSAAQRGGELRVSLHIKTYFRAA
jgi:Tfp pilus assembly protein PilO